MKIGIAKFDAGIRVAPPPEDYSPADGGSRVIEKGREYYVPDDYDFDFKAAIFTEKEKKKGVKDGGLSKQ